MCNSAVHRPFNGIVDPFSFSTFHLLRTCNRLMIPTEAQSYYGMMKEGNFSHPLKSPSIDPKELLPQPVNLFPPNFGGGVLQQKLPENEKLSATLPPVISIVGNTGSCSPLQYDYGHTEYPLSELNRSSVFSTFMQRRPRGEKRPIPDEQKDEKYYERRKRNNEAAKKSRDARKIREDRIAFRAALLEQENSILRAQVVALRNELQSVRQLLATGPTDRQPQI